MLSTLILPQENVVNPGSNPILNNTLYRVQAYNNILTELDISTNIGIRDINIENNDLTCIKVWDANIANNSSNNSC